MNAQATLSAVQVPAIIVEDLHTETARLPAAYKAAQIALANCVDIDECKTWSDKAQALASYARQADDETLQKHAMRIQSRAVRRCGELLKEFTSFGGRPKETRDGAVPSFPSSQREAAAQAGLSDRQQKTAIRVANVPSDLFDAAVDSDAPPTVTKLADWGKQRTEKPPVPVGFHAANVVLMGHMRRMAEFCDQNTITTIGVAVEDFNRTELRRNVTKVRRWLKSIAPMLRSNQDGL